MNMSNSVRWIAGLFCVFEFIVPRFGFCSEKIEVFNDFSPTRGKPIAVTTRFVVGGGDGVNKRVWIETEIRSDYKENADFDQEVVTVKKKIDGLFYDEKTHQVSLKLGGSAQPIVCGEWTDGNFFLTSKLKPNGICTFVTKVESQPSDDGYHVKQKAHLTVDLIY